MEDQLLRGQVCPNIGRMSEIRPDVGQARRAVGALRIEEILS
jgi:hypothetical protein